MPRFGAIDIGSNAVRLRIVEATDPTSLREVAFVRAPVRLGKSVFLTGKLTGAAITAGVQTLERFRDAMRTASVDGYRCVATSAVRTAENGAAFVERARREAGIEIEVIDGFEEARLERIAVLRRLPLGRDKLRSLLLDLGGGSLEITAMEGETPLTSASVNIGTVRMLEAFLKGGGPVAREEEELLVEYVDRMIRPVLKQLRGAPFDLVMGTGGNFETMAVLCPAVMALGPAEGATEIAAIDVPALRALLPRIAGIGAAERQAAFGLRPDRADVIVPAIVAVLRIAEGLRVERIAAPSVGITHGIVAELVERHFHAWDQAGAESAVLSAALALGRRYQFDEQHGTLVAALAMSLFDQLAALHGLGPEERTLLRIGALLHDIGDFVNYDGHHKHSQYILESTDIIGLSPVDRQIVANLARYHRRSVPTTAHLGFKKLDRRGRAIVLKLSALLRVADALDREHQGKVRAITARAAKDRVTLEIDGAEEIGLELWTVERKAALFEKVFGRKLRVTTLVPRARVRSADRAERRSLERVFQRG